MFQICAPVALAEGQLPVLDNANGNARRLCIVPGKLLVNRGFDRRIVALGFTHSGTKNGEK